ncbi:MAG: alpha/beta hydrolase family protein [Planctomycetota bacterium]
MGTRVASVAAIVWLACRAGLGAPVPGTVDELWADFDPRAEPLEVEVARDWERDGCRYKVVTFTAGVFRGTNVRECKVRVAAFYGYPKGKRRLPAILHIHGGGQRANLRYLEYWVGKLGYAAASVNWGGFPMPGEAEGSPNTVWGELAGGFGQGERRFQGGIAPGRHRLHKGLHPMNSSWYLTAVACRRALTFLERQPEVDPKRLGVTGHSMGGNLTVKIAMDPRVKAATPSVGGTGNLMRDLWGLPGSKRNMQRVEVPLFERTVDSRAYWPRIRAPLLFLGATNDFNSPTELVIEGLSRLPKSTDSRLVLAPHLNHRFTPETFVARPLWFEAHLKDGFDFPKTSRAELKLDGPGGAPGLARREGRHLLWLRSRPAHALLGGRACEAGGRMLGGEVPGLPPRRAAVCIRERDVCA